MSAEELAEMKARHEEGMTYFFHPAPPERPEHEHAHIANICDYVTMLEQQARSQAAQIERDEQTIFGHVDGHLTDAKEIERLHGILARITVEVFHREPWEIAEMARGGFPPGEKMSKSGSAAVDTHYRCECGQEMAREADTIYCVNAACCRFEVPFMVPLVDPERVEVRDADTNPRGHQKDSA